jgi:hypothetical protein
MRRYDVHDPADMAELIRTGLVWKGGPATIDLAIEYLQDHPEAVNDLVPPAVVAELQPAPPPPVTDDELAEAPAAADELPEGEAPVAPPAP